MTANKHWKRKVRARAERDGVSYTEAKRRLDAERLAAVVNDQGLILTGKIGGAATVRPLHNDGTGVFDSRIRTERELAKLRDDE